MGQLLKDSLPQPPAQYNQNTFNQLIRKLQRILRTRIETKDEADEAEAIQFFISN